MEYTKIDFNGIDDSPINQEQLIRNVGLKIKKMEEANDEENRAIANFLLSALNWLKESNESLPVLENGEYYRLGYYILPEKKIIFNVQIWKRFSDDVDILKKIYMSNYEDDLDNDDDTIIVPNSK